MLNRIVLFCLVRVIAFMRAAMATLQRWVDAAESGDASQLALPFGDLPAHARR